MPDQDTETITDPLTLIWKQRTGLIIRLMNFFGLPLLLLLLAGWGVHSAWFWATPIAEQIAKQHIATLKEMSETQGAIAKSIEKQAENGREFVLISKQHRDRTDEMAKQLNDVHQVIVRKKDVKE
jgi:hypothetical protein